MSQLLRLGYIFYKSQQVHENYKISEMKRTRKYLPGKQCPKWNVDNTRINRKRLFLNEASNEYVFSFAAKLIPPLKLEQLRTVIINESRGKKCRRTSHMNGFNILFW